MCFLHHQGENVHSYEKRKLQDQSVHDGYHNRHEELLLHQSRNADRHQSHNRAVLLLQCWKVPLLNHSCKDHRNPLHR